MIPSLRKHTEEKKKIFKSLGDKINRNNKLRKLKNITIFKFVGDE